MESFSSGYFSHVFLYPPLTVTQHVRALNDSIRQNPPPWIEINTRIQSLVEIIISNGIYWKVFKKWSKELNITLKQLDRSNINKIIEIAQMHLTHFQSLTNLETKLAAAEQLQRANLHFNRTIEGEIPLFDALKEFDHVFLK